MLLLLLVLFSKSRRHCAFLRTNTCNTLGTSVILHNDHHANKYVRAQHCQRCIAAVQPDVSSRREAVFHCIRGMFTVLMF